MNAPEKLPLGVYAKLQSARINLQSVQMKKSGHNKFAGYSYFELGDFLPVINSIFSEIGLCGVVSFTSASAELTIIDTSDGSRIVFTCPMAEAQLKGCHPVQNLGASITYLRRYLYTTALEIVEHDALDATTGNEKPVKESSKSVAKATQELLGDEATAYLKDQAMEVLSKLPDEVAMYETYQEIKKTLDADEIVAMWGFLDSKSRASIKRGGEMRLAGQS